MRTIFRTTNPRPDVRPRGFRRGFTLIEAALTTVIIGVGVMAMLELLASGTASNIDAASMTTASNLAKQVREITVQKPFDEILAMDGDVHDPPWDGSGLPMNSLAGWKQSIRVQSVDPHRLKLTTFDDDPDAVRITVTISHNEQKVADVSWLRFK